MQKLLTPRLICRIRGVDDRGHRILYDLRQHHLKRVIFLPSLLNQWRGKLKGYGKDREKSEGLSSGFEKGSWEEAKVSPSEAKEGLRMALGAYCKRKLIQTEDPVVVKRLRTTKKLFTVLKGPHIDKKAREQFFFKTYGVELSMKMGSMSNMALMETLMRFYETGTNEFHITARF